MAQEGAPNQALPDLFGCLLVIMAALLKPGPVLAEEYPAYRESVSSAIDLRHEPIQPLFATENLDPQKVGLGARLFRDNTMACISCHDLSTNGADHPSYSPSHHGDALAVNTLTIFNSSRNHYQL